ncbi:MAG: hypothetical protein ACQES7_04290 [Pseudomonadota bacterium]
MSGIATAVVGSAVIGAYSSKKAGDAQAKASASASDAQVIANQQNIDFQKEIFEQQREDAAPWREVGAKSIQQLRTAIDRGMFNPSQLKQGESFKFDQAYSFDGDIDQGQKVTAKPLNVDLEADPGYQFRREEGMNALDASAAARGRLQSGAQARATTRYASDLASQEYGNAYGRAVYERDQDFSRRTSERDKNFMRSASERDAAFGRYNQQFSTQYGMAADQYNRSRDQALTQIDLERQSKSDSYNRLASLANVGQVANQSTQSARAQMASSVGQSTTATGNALAQGALGAGQARASSYQNMAGAANQGIQNYLLYDMMGS